MGAGRQVGGKVGRQPPPRRPPPGTAAAVSAGNPGDKPPLGHCFPKEKPVPPGFSRRGAGGASPRQNKVKSLPLPRRGRGLGGWGQKDKLKAGSDGNHPPAAPLRGQRRQSQPATPGTSPLGALLSKGKARAARVQPRGCKGRSPLHEITLILPLPAGKGDGGMGEKRQTNGMVGRRGERQTPPWAPVQQSQPATPGTSPPPGTETAESVSAVSDLAPGMQGAKPLA